jgi:hypothetical protein
MTPEGKILAAVIRRLESLRAAGVPIWWFKVHGGPMQQAGVPDLHVTCRGASVWLEIKRPGGKATPLQVETMRRIDAAGGVTAVIDSPDDVRDLLQ